MEIARPCGTVELGEFSIDLGCAMCTGSRAKHDSSIGPNGRCMSSHRHEGFCTSLDGNQR